MSTSIEKVVSEYNSRRIEWLASLLWSVDIESATVAQLRAEDEGSQQYPLSLDASAHRSTLFTPAGVIRLNEAQIREKAADESPPIDFNTSIASNPLSPLNVEDMTIEPDTVLPEPDSAKEGTHTYFII